MNIKSVVVEMRNSLIENRVSPTDMTKDKDEETRADTDGIGFCGYLIVALSVIMTILTMPFSMLFFIKIIKEYERAVIFRLGRIMSGGAKGPGLFLIVPCVDSLKLMDLRTIMFDVPPQDILTKDSVTVVVDAVVYYNCFNPVLAVTTVADVDTSTKYLAQTTLRNVLGAKTLSEILSDRDSISHAISGILDRATDPWGIKVERVEVKDVRLPQQLQRSMAAEAEANREANAKIIAAEGEKKASRSLKEAAEIISESPAALQLRYLQTLQTISQEKNSTVIFPLPMEVMSFFVDSKNGP